MRMPGVQAALGQPLGKVGRPLGGTSKQSAYPDFELCAKLATDDDDGDDSGDGDDAEAGDDGDNDAGDDGDDDEDDSLVVRMSARSRHP